MVGSQYPGQDSGAAVIRPREYCRIHNVALGLGVSFLCGQGLRLVAIFFYLGRALACCHCRYRHGVPTQPRGKDEINAEP